MANKTFYYHCLIYEFQLGNPILIVKNNICNIFGEDIFNCEEFRTMLGNFTYGNSLFGENNERTVLFFKILEQVNRKHNNIRSKNNPHLHQNINL